MVDANVDNSILFFHTSISSLEQVSLPQPKNMGSEGPFFRHLKVHNFLFNPKTLPTIPFLRNAHGDSYN